MIFWIVWLVMGVGGILWFSGWVIPKIMFKTHAATLPVGAKAVDRYKDDFGETVVYVPSAAARQYISRYRIGHDEKGLYFCGELAKKAAYAEYELTVYNVDNNVVQILRVKEKFNASNETALTRLPDQADYVELRLICLDDNPIPAERTRFTARYAIWLAVLCACLVAATDLLIWLVASFILRCQDNFTMTMTLPSSTWAALLCLTGLGIVLITCSISLVGFFLRKRGDIDE